MRRFLAVALAALVFLGFATAGAYVYPMTAAVVCPACYGMESAGPRTIVDRAMPGPLRDAVAGGAGAASSTVREFYGAFHRRPYLVACSTEECDRRMGGKGAKAVTLSTPLVTILRVSPRGIDPTILTHEFSHVELHRRIGLRALLTGAVPAWFDEGVAVLVSADARYLGPDGTCLRQAEGALPASPFEWGSQAGADPMIYADAACRVLRWMEANGGRDGLLQALEAVAGGKGFPG